MGLREALGGAGSSAAAVPGSSSLSDAPPVQGDVGPPATAAVTPVSPPSSAMSSESNPPATNPNMVDLVRQVDQAHGRYSAASVEVERLQQSLQAVEVAREEETIARGPTPRTLKLAPLVSSDLGHVPIPLCCCTPDSRSQGWRRNWARCAMRWRNCDGASTR